MTPRYRAWIKTEKRMFLSDDILNIDYENKEIVTQQVYFKNGLPDDRDIYFYDFDEIVLMQSTRLKDKNGKEIFDGDILEIQDEGEVLGNAKLTWDNEQAVFMIEAISVDDIAPFHEILSDESYSYRVVGNVYENKEVLDA
ncbi:YopX family protein [Streptococcus pseudopneumoniae]|uniref:YopX protein domain-containing protein n=1 Tax=Streptococcus pseudopneumoniae TaxID=257758 RepID=A0A3A4S1I6_9STRE|nr:YopX family protein [Streptococcus pseudopneumoniae]MBF9651785.1 hypothetical protein [Streptococcus pseudopneumoniae]RJP81823.1 hypothetical protein C5O68_06650 [Streptococcus pseudopneumoniae]